MWRKLVWKTTDILNWLACRPSKRAKRPISLDDDSPRFYSLTLDEQDAVVRFLELMNIPHEPGEKLTEEARWRVLGWDQALIYLERGLGAPHRGPHSHLQGGFDDMAMPIGQSPGDEKRLANSDAVQKRDLGGVQKRGLPSSSRGAQSAYPPLPGPTEFPRLDDRRSLFPSTPTATPTPTSTTSRASPSPPPLSTTPLTPETLKVLLDTFDHALSHTHYAVCGHAALMVWGYRPLPPGRPGPGSTRPTMTSHVSIVCPAEDKPVILSWARAAGWHVYRYPSDSDSAAGGGGGDEVIGVPASVSIPPSPASNCSGKREQELVRTEVWGFRLRSVEDSEVWRRLGRVRPLGMEPPYLGSVGEMIRTGAQVMDVPTLLDEFARAWYFCAVKRGGGSDRGGGVEREQHIAELILWLLCRVAADAERYGDEARWMLTPLNVPCLVYEKFTDAFVSKYPEAANLLEASGVRCPVVVEGEGEDSQATTDGRHTRGSPNDVSQDSYTMRIARGETRKLANSSNYPLIQEALYRELELACSTLSPSQESSG